MDTMLQKQSRTEALNKRSERSQMITKDVPPTMPGTYFMPCLILNCTRNSMSNAGNIVLVYSVTDACNEKSKVKENC